MAAVGEIKFGTGSFGAQTHCTRRFSTKSHGSFFGKIGCISLFGRAVVTEDVTSKLTKHFEKKYEEFKKLLMQSDGNEGRISHSLTQVISWKCVIVNFITTLLKMKGI